jgi:hypothetical protein
MRKDGMNPNRARRGPEVHLNFEFEQVKMSPCHYRVNPALKEGVVTQDLSVMVRGLLECVGRLEEDVLVFFDIYHTPCDLLEGPPICF